MKVLITGDGRNSGNIIIALLEVGRENMANNQSPIPGIVEEIRKALDAATPGTWEHTDYPLGQYVTAKYTFNVVEKADARLIANAPTWLRSMLEENERLSIALHTHESYDKTVTELHEENQQLREELEHIQQCSNDWRRKCLEAQAESQSLRSELAAKDKVLEWYSNPGNHVYSDKGQRARIILSQYATINESQEQEDEIVQAMNSGPIDYLLDGERE